MRRLILFALVLVMASLVAGRSAVSAGGLSDARDSDPVVLTGADVPSLLGIEPQRLVAFRHGDGWEQIPVQVDERDTKYFEDIYQSSSPWGGSNISGVSAVVYTDSATFTGPDFDPALDADDEIAFMAKDAGGPSPVLSNPTGVIAGTGVEVSISDPLDPGASGYVYLFRSDGTLDPGAGRQYVSYVFNLLSGDYLETYDTLDGPNPENSTATTAYYSDHFSDRWINDAMRVGAGGASGVDILDRHKNLFGPGICTRSEDTFSNAEGAFIANKGGPVRAIRSYVGANSGPLTQRENVFYEQRQDIRTFLRVHSIGGMMDFFDYSPDASGMTYYNSLNTAGVLIDGNPDAVTSGAIQWEMVTGSQGSLVIGGSISTNMSLPLTSYHLDDTTPPVTQCTGDAYAYGSSGLWINGGLACTDPSQGCTNYLRSVRTIYYGPPGFTVEDAQRYAATATTALTYAIDEYPSSAPVGGVVDGELMVEPAAAHGSNSGQEKALLAGIVSLVACASTLAVAMRARPKRRRGGG